MKNIRAVRQSCAREQKEVSSMNEKKVLILTLIWMLLPVAGMAQPEGTGEAIRPALVVVDVQNAYLPLMSEQEQKIALRVINGAIWFFRQHKLPVVRVHHSDLRWGPAEGTKEFAFVDTILPPGEDVRVVKRFPSAFVQTDLDRILKEKGCNTVFLCGLSATGCVLPTYFGGVERGYKVFMIREGIMSHNPDYTNAVKDICDSLSFESMMFFLQLRQ
jgi:nicotinamidase-related amidase